MRLDQWVKREGHGAKAKLARDTGLGFNVILYLVSGKRLPSARSALLIQKATGGEVTLAELLVAKPRPKPKRRRSVRKERVRKTRTPARAAA